MDSVLAVYCRGPQSNSLRSPSEKVSSSCTENVYSSSSVVEDSKRC